MVAPRRSAFRGQHERERHRSLMGVRGGGELGQRCWWRLPAVASPPMRMLDLAPLFDTLGPLPCRTGLPLWVLPGGSSGVMRGAATTAQVPCRSRKRNGQPGQRCRVVTQAQLVHPWEGRSWYRSLTPRACSRAEKGCSSRFLEAPASRRWGDMCIARAIWVRGKEPPAWPKALHDRAAEAV